jgi:DUF1009 family protein
VFIIGLEGFAEPPVLAPFPHGFSRIGAAGRILDLLRDNHCADVVMIGRVRRPGFFDLRPDAVGMRLIGRIGRSVFGGGDDTLLAAVVKILGEEGFRVLGAHEILTEALAPAGVLGRIAPDPQAMADIKRGVAVARALGAADVGQGCVVQQGLVLAVEAIEGTDAMLGRAAGLRRGGMGGVLVKVSKPGQERRADLPTIGATTIAQAAAAGLRGVAFEAGGALLADRAATIAAADQAGLFLIGLDIAGM